jgi:hypothetical protein
MTKTINNKTVITTTTTNHQKHPKANSIQSRNAYEECVRFYSNPQNYASLVQIVKSNVGEKNRISLRTYDYFCKQWGSKRTHWICSDGRSVGFVYQQKLKTFHKSEFDPFRRQSNQKPFWFHIRPDDPERFPPIFTTRAQLLYCKFVIERKINHIVKTNLPSIQKSMKKRNLSNNKH